ncbi:MAG: hypothetical protein GTO12_09525, partial [Proteobacteria bacterium]|nr:hypothetical protein [Pseudomonadota bacterium]
MKIIASFLSFGLISVFVGVSGISAWAVTISGTVEIVDLESGEGIPLVGARVSALDMDDRAVDADISNDAGEFSLDVSEEIDLHILVRGPVFPDEYVDTYGPFFNSGTEDIEDMKGRIVRKS